MLIMTRRWWFRWLTTLIVLPTNLNTFVSHTKEFWFDSIHLNVSSTIVQPNEQVRKTLTTDKHSHEVVIMKQNWWLIAKLIFQYAGVGELIEIAIESWRWWKSESVAHAVIKRTIMTRFYRYCGRPTATLKNFCAHCCCSKLVKRWALFQRKTQLHLSFSRSHSIVHVCVWLLIHEILRHLLGQRVRRNRSICGIVAWKLVTV